MSSLKKPDYFISGGYFFTQGKNPPEWANLELLPQTLWSVSSVISDDMFPDSWVFSWGGDRDDRDKTYFQKQLGMDISSFSEMQSFFDELYEQKKVGFPNIVYSLSLARELYKRYFWKVPNLKLLGLGLSETHIDEFATKMAFPSQYLKSSLRYKVLQLEKLPDDGVSLGFDILGFDGAIFWAFITNNFETQFWQNLGIRLNSHGYIDSYDDAVIALEYARTHHPEEGKWFLWKVIAYDPGNNFNY